MDWDSAYFYRRQDHQPSAGHGEFVAWLDQHFGLPVTQDPDAAVAAAQAEPGQQFTDQARPFLPG